MVAIAALAVFALACPEPAGAGGCRDLEDAWLLPPGRIVILLSRMKPDHADTARVSPAARAWFSAGLGRLYGMPELPLRAVAAGWPALRCAWAASWQRLGTGMLTEDRLRLRFLQGGDHRLGLGGGLDRLRAGGGRTAVLGELSAEVVWPGPGGVVGRVSWPLATMGETERRRAWRRWLGVTGGGGDLVWAVAVDRSGTGRPAIQLELTARLATGCGLSCRAEPATGTVGINTAWLWRGALLRTSHLVHPDLGVTHRWSLTLGRPGPDPAP
jgi:hypothetical protein